MTAAKVASVALHLAQSAGEKHPKNIEEFDTMTEDDAVKKPESAPGNAGGARWILPVMIDVIIALIISLNLLPAWLQKALLVAAIVGSLLLILFSVVVKWSNTKVGASVAVILIIISAGIGIVGWNWITAKPTPLPYVASAMSITNPADGDSINGVNVTVRGTSQLNISNQSIWVLVYPQNAPSRFYPQQPAQAEGGGRWECNVYLGTNNTNTLGKYDVYAVIVDNSSATNFQNYLNNSNEQRSWPGVSSQPGVISYDHITLTRVQ